MQSSIRKKWCKGIRTSYLLLLILLSSCGGKHLSVQTDFVTEEDLASFYVNTPDPLLNSGSAGQRLHVSWSLPKSYYGCEEMHILIQIRYKNREEAVLPLNNLRCNGTYTFSILNDEYFEKEGIRTYKVQLFSGETLIEEWVHQLWVELITFDELDEK